MPDNASGKPARPSAPVDFVIVTALEEERDAVLSALGTSRRLDKEDGDIHTYYAAEIQTDRLDCSRYQIIVTCLTNMGPITATGQTVTVVNRWRPGYVLLVGIACGIPGEVRHGDVMVATQVADYTLGKRQKGKRHIRWESFQAGTSLLDSSNNLPDGWQKKIPINRPGEGKAARQKGVIVSGGDVIQDDKALARFRQDWPKLIGIEMESGGVAAGINQTDQRPEFLMIKAVSDFGSDKKDPKVEPWRPYACHAAAVFAISLIKSGPSPAIDHGPDTDRATAPELEAKPVIHLPAFTPDTFIGRTTFLETLDRWTSSPGTFLLSGDPGSGKSLLAQMFAWKAQSRYEAIIYQTCGQRPVEAIAADLADKLKPQLGDAVTQLPPEEKIKAIQQWLSGRRALLILDDIWLPDPPAKATSPNQPAPALTINNLLPSPPASVLFTSRRPSLPWCPPIAA